MLEVEAEEQSRVRMFDTSNIGRLGVGAGSSEVFQDAKRPRPNRL
jgi:hypothetical protein